MGTRGYSAIGEGTWIPAFAGKTGGGWRHLWRLVGRWAPGGGRGFRLLPERRVGSGGVYGNWRAWRHREGTWVPAFAGKTELGHLGGDVGSGFRWKDGNGGGVYGNWRAWRHREGTWIPPFARKTELRHRRGDDVDSGFRRN